MTSLRVTPSPLAPNYAPAYLADELGLFRERSLEVDDSIYAGPGSSWLADNLLADKADIALGGIWIPLMYRGRIADLRIFALVCDRNPQVLLSRSSVSNFKWSDLYGKQVLLPMSSTSQWMFLEGVMLEDGVDIDRIQFVKDLDEPTATRLWRSGLSDYYLVSSPLKERLVDDGYSVAVPIAQLGAQVPWSVYYTTQAFLERPDEAFMRFAESIQAALDFLHSQPAKTIAEVLGERFSDVPRTDLESAIETLKVDSVWPTSVQVTRPSFDRYQQIIADYGLIDEPQPFEEVVVQL